MGKVQRKKGVVKKATKTMRKVQNKKGPVDDIVEKNGGRQSDTDDDPLISKVNEDEKINGTPKTGTKRNNPRSAKKITTEVEKSDNEDADKTPTNDMAGSKRKSIKKTPKAQNSKRQSRGKQNEEGNEKSVVEEEYEVANVVDHKVDSGVSYFLVRWKGYSKNEDTWEPENSLSCPDLIEKYKKTESDKMTDEPANKKSKMAKTKRVIGKETTNGNEDKEWEVKKIVDYVEQKNGRIFRIRWKGFRPKDDTWEKEENLNCDELINDFMKNLKAQDNVSVKELREHPVQPRRLVNETRNSGRKSRRYSRKQRVFYNDDDQ